MGRYTDLPTLNIDFMKPKRAIFDMPGAGIDSGRNGVGESISIEFSGGGMVSCVYEDCFVQAREEHEYLSWIAARGRGGFRFFNVPILTDWTGPFATNGLGVPQPFVTGIPHSDGSLFSDGAGYSQPTVWGKITEAAALNAGVVSMRVYEAARQLRWSDWFSIYHTTKGWRAYSYWEVQSVSDEVTETIDGNDYTARDYVLAVTPPLREATAAGTRVELTRPMCVMKFPVGFTLPHEIEGFWRSNPTYQFIEAF